MRQLSFFEQRPLFHDAILQRFLRESEAEAIQNASGINAWLVGWLRETQRGRGKETSLEQDFNAEFFCGALGYTRYPGDGVRWTAWPKPPAEATGLSAEPDLLLGTFDRDEGRFQPTVVVELKKPGTALDAPQSGRGNRSPVEQAFSYASALPTCRWVIVTDMREIRLYGAAGRDRFADFDLRRCTDFLGITDEFRTMHRLLHCSALIESGDGSTTARLLAASLEEQLSVQRGFYDLYSDIRLELLRHFSECDALTRFNKHDHILSAQRLLDRILFICFCEDHPDRLLPKDTTKNVTDRALWSPGPSTCKVYAALKQLFRDLDVGVKTDYWTIPRYNGELFKYDPIIDTVDIPDQLHKKKFYYQNGSARGFIEGLWGLHVFDFWRDLDKDLLGNVFERSIADIAHIADDEALIHETVRERKDLGVYYTSMRLARFVAESVVEEHLAHDRLVQSALAEIAESKNPGELERGVRNLSWVLEQTRVLDPACGSGVFLTSALSALLRPLRSALEASRTLQVDFVDRLKVAAHQAGLLKATMYGVDYLPQAIELAKLALWLTAARRDEPAADLSANIVAEDSFSPAALAAHERIAPKGYDIVLGNPPWGGQYEPAFVGDVLRCADVEPRVLTDTWEFFVVLAWLLLKPGGRMALLLPDTIFSADKFQIRKFLSDRFMIEKMYALGPDWFGPSVRMGTISVQARKGEPSVEHVFRGLVLSGERRNKAFVGALPLRQLETIYAHNISQERVRESDSRELRLACSELDWELMGKIQQNSVQLGAVTDRWRGEEMSADGLVWRCPGCGGYTVPGAKRKGGGYASKACPLCSLQLTEATVSTLCLVNDQKRDQHDEPYVDGSSLQHRYGVLTMRWIRTDLAPFVPGFKTNDIYRGVKILIRQAGVGVAATILTCYARCPQSIYIYKCSEDGRQAGYSEHFILAALVSRTMNYFVLKRFGEVDPARAYAKITHARLESLPVPKISCEEDSRLVTQISADAQSLLASRAYGGEVDNRIELSLRRLWKLSPEEGAYINTTFSLLPSGQAVRDLFPDGPPTRSPGRGT